MMRKTIICTIVLCLLFSLAGCTVNTREYLEQICIPVSGRDGEIVICEWYKRDTHCCAEIYYRQGRTMTMLGRTYGAEDGYCPFADGKYSVTVDGDTVLVRWSFYRKGPEEEWSKETFTLPAEKE